MPKYSFEEIKTKLSNEFGAELSLHMYDKEYMIIIFENRVSFQRCGVKGEGSGEIFYHSLDELYNTETVDGILLSRDWNDIVDFYCFFVDL